VISIEARPKLAAKVRLRYDRRGERYMLLWPERGMVLNPTAAEIVKLCTGEATVAEIVDQLATKYPGQPKDVLEPQLLEFLVSMADRGLMDGTR
jgi:coenzyme PQQ biosynthesis protein PqqD